MEYAQDTTSNKGSVKQNFLQFTGFSHFASAAQKMPNLKKLVGKTLAIKAVNFVGFYTVKILLFTTDISFTFS